jgi:hypothetical protein
MDLSHWKRPEVLHAPEPAETDFHSWPFFSCVSVRGLLSQSEGVRRGGILVNAGGVTMFAYAKRLTIHSLEEHSKSNERASGAWEDSR